MTAVVADCDVVVQMKQHLKVQLDHYFVITELHRVAALLDLRQKGNRKLMSSQQHEETVTSLRQLVDEVGETQPAETAESAASAERDECEPASKRLRQDADRDVTTSAFFGDLFMDSGSGSATTASDEVTDYMQSAVAASDIMTFWQEKAVKWPTLSSVARNVLSIPAASTSSERSFSVAGRTEEDRRCQLKRDTVDGLLFLNSIMK